MNTYLITGATSDLGRELIRNLVKDDENKIVACGFNDEYKLEDYREHIQYFDLDLSDKTKVNEFICVLETTNINPTHFVHFPALPVVNANFKNFDEERFSKDLDLQVFSAIKLSKYVLKGMKKAGFGRIVFMQSSYTISTPPKNVAAYTMAKSALGALTKSLAIEYAKYGVTVNCVAPSMIETNFIKDLNHIVVEMSAANNPMGRNARVEDVIPAILFLLSEDAGFITGVTLPITGGSVML